MCTCSFLRNIREFILNTLKNIIFLYHSDKLFFILIQKHTIMLYNDIIMLDFEPLQLKISINSLLIIIALINY